MFLCLLRKNNCFTIDRKLKEDGAGVTINISFVYDVYFLLAILCRKS